MGSTGLRVLCCLNLSSKMEDCCLVSLSFFLGLPSSSSSLTLEQTLSNSTSSPPKSLSLLTLEFENEDAALRDEACCWWASIIPYVSYDGARERRDGEKWSCLRNNCFSFCWWWSNRKMFSCLTRQPRPRPRAVLQISSNPIVVKAKTKHWFLMLAMDKGTYRGWGGGRDYSSSVLLQKRP